ncbi:unnamed protein product, partial [Pylaiella littoralis]
AFFLAFSLFARFSSCGGIFSRSETSFFLLIVKHANDPRPEKSS